MATVAAERPTCQTHVRPSQSGNPFSAADGVLILGILTFVALVGLYFYRQSYKRVRREYERTHAEVASDPRYAAIDVGWSSSTDVPTRIAGSGDDPIEMDTLEPQPQELG